MSSERLIVVGGGLLGSVAAALAREFGREVTVIDSAEPEAGSPAAAGLVHEPWLPKAVPDYQAGLETIDRLYGWKKLSFRAVSLSGPPTKAVSEYRLLSPSTVLCPDPVRETVREVRDGLVLTDRGEHRGLVYVAAGAWTPRLVACPPVSPRAGLAMFYPGETEPLMAYYSGFHYERGYLFTREPGVTYFCDGAAVRAEAWSAKHAERATARASLLGLGRPAGARKGLRPFCAAGPWFGRVAPKVWAATGAAKYGTVTAGAFAARLLRQLP